MNSINVTGRLTADPELASTTGGTSVCKLRLAFETRRGEPVFIDVESYGKGGKAAAERLHKGDQIGVTGELALDEWKDRETDQPRSRHYVVGRIHFLGSGKREDRDAAGADDVEIDF